MPNSKKTIGLVGIICLLFAFGCQPANQAASPTTWKISPTLTGFETSAINIVPLTAFDCSKSPPRLKVYVDLLDQFGSRKKTPALFRFELYEFIPHEADHRGSRLTLWPDIDLSEVADNNSRWRDYLRAYEFDLDLDFTPEKGQTFVLQATCLTPAGHRLAAALNIEYK